MAKNYWGPWEASCPQQAIAQTNGDPGQPLTARTGKPSISPSCTSASVTFNPFNRENEHVLTAGHEEERCINCIVSPLEQGLLGNGKGSSGLVKLGKKDIRHRNPAFHSATKQEKTTQIHNACHQQKCSVVTAVLLWILQHEHTDIIITGPKNRKQLRETLHHTLLIDSVNVCRHQIPGDNCKKEIKNIFMKYAGSQVASLFR